MIQGNFDDNRIHGNSPCATLTNNIEHSNPKETLLSFLTPLDIAEHIASIVQGNGTNITSNACIDFLATPIQSSSNCTSTMIQSWSPTIMGASVPNIMETSEISDNGTNSPPDTKTYTGKRGRKDFDVDQVDDTGYNTVKKECTKKDFTEFMCSWLRDNWTNPYPDDEGLSDIARKCGTTPSVVSNWLINARTRKWRPAIIKAYEKQRPADLLKEDSINIFDGKPLRDISSNSCHL